MSAMQHPFVSPLQIKLHTAFTGIDFGPVALLPEVAHLRQELNDILFQTTASLPEPPGSEARSILRNYSGGDGDFYRLFYVPIWSFLHWVTVTAPTPITPEFRYSALTAHAMSLFLHLWDDHLCDGQLTVDLLRLQVRTLAWQRFTAESHRLCEWLGVASRLVDEHTTKYLLSLHCPPVISDFDGYCRCFIDQVAIWILVPRLLGCMVAGPELGEELCKVINFFALSWRLLDDIQDIHLDLITTKQTAVWYELDDAGRQLWNTCRSRSLLHGKLDPEAWSELSTFIRVSGCLHRLLARIDEYLQLAVQVSTSHGWHGLAQELVQARQGISNAATNSY